MKKSNKNYRNSKYTISKLFRNDKFLIVFAFVISCILWFVFSQNSGEETVTTVTDIPINIELSQDAVDSGFEVFSMGNETASVKISGNKITVGSVRSDDILVTATAGAITSSNTYPLQLTAKQNSSKTNYSIVSVDPTFVNVYIDKRRSMQFEIQDKIKYDYSIDPTYYAGNPVYSTKKITVSGPETEVKKIDYVAITGEITGQLKSTAEIDADVVLYDSFGDVIESDLLSLSVSTVNVSVPIMPEKEVPIKAKFSNVPSDIDIDSLVTVEPSSISVAASETTLRTLPEVDLPIIDFSTIDPTKDTEFELDVTLPSDCRNISNVTKAKVKINLDGYTTEQITITDFTFKNVSSNSTAKATTTDITVTVAGSEDYISSLTSEDLTAVIDLKDKGNDFVGSTEIPVTITIDNGYCWVIGSYSVNVSVEKNSDSSSSSSSE